MFITRAEVRPVEKPKPGTAMYCPYCQKDLFGNNNFDVYRHDCDGEFIFFVNGYLFVGVQEYNYLEKNSTWLNRNK